MKLLTTPDLQAALSRPLPPRRRLAIEAELAERATAQVRDSADPVALVRAVRGGGR